MEFKTAFKSKINKYFVILPIILIFISSIIIPSSAESSFISMPIEVTKVWTNHVDDDNYFTNFDNYSSITIPYNSGKNAFAALLNFNNDDTSNYYDYKFEFDFSYIDPTDILFTFNGVVYEPKRNYDYTHRWYIEISQVKLYSGTGRLDLNFTFTTALGGDIYLLGYYRQSDVNAIIDNQNENTDKIISAQQEATEQQTDELLNGWSTDAAPDEEATTDYSDIEGALIDKTQSNSEEASAELNDNFLGSIQRYISGFGAVSQMFSDMLLVQMPDINGLIWFSTDFEGFAIVKSFYGLYQHLSDVITEQMQFTVVHNGL